MKIEKNEENFIKLLKLRHFLGDKYGTEDFSIFLYALIRMQKFRNIVELGTGFGLTSFWMAQATKENGFGKVSTIDDASGLDLRYVNGVFAPLLNELGLKIPGSNIDDYWNYLKSVTLSLGLSQHITHYDTRIATDLSNLEKNRHPFLKRPIGLLFSDFVHSYEMVLNILKTFLPLMADISSIFIDSASSKLPTYVALEHIVRKLNSGIIPKNLAKLLSSSDKKKLEQKIQSSRFTLVHLIEHKNRDQNSTVWIKIEPGNLLCYPDQLVRSRDFNV